MPRQCRVFFLDLDGSGQKRPVRMMFTSKQAAPDACSLCGGIGGRLCDWPEQGGKDGCCSASLCSDCAVTVGRKDYCPSHVSHRQESLL